MPANVCPIWGCESGELRSGSSSLSNDPVPPQAIEAAGSVNDYSKGVISDLGRVPTVQSWPNQAPALDVGMATRTCCLKVLTPPHSIA
jgi:hypothetical protein